MQHKKQINANKAAACIVERFRVIILEQEAGVKGISLIF